MKAITFRGTESVALETVPDPKIEASTDVIVKNRLTAICGSDLHVYFGRETGNDPVLPPLSVGEMTLRLYAALNYSPNRAHDLRRALNGA